MDIFTKESNDKTFDMVLQINAIELDGEGNKFGGTGEWEVQTYFNQG